MLRPLTRLRPVLTAGAPRAQLPFIPSRPGGPNWRPSGPISAPVGLTSCIFLMRHQYAPLRLPMETARGSCACSLDSIRVLNPSGLRRRTRRGGAWAGARSPGAEEGGWSVGREPARLVGRRPSDLPRLEPSPLGSPRDNRSPGPVPGGGLSLVPSRAQGQTLYRLCLEVLGSNPAPEVAFFHLRDERLPN